MRIVKHWAIAVMAATALGLAGCGGGGSSPSTTTQMPAQTQTPYQKADAAIKAATTDAAVDKAVADATAGVSGEELAKLQAAAAARKTVLATMAREMDQKKALMDALAEVDTSDLSDADKLAAAKAAIAALKEALDDAGDVSDANKATYRTQLASAQTAVDRKEQMNALSGASGKLDMALAAFAGVTPTKAQLDAAMAALRELKAAIAGAEDLTDDEKDRYQAQADRADADDGQIKTAQGHYHDHVVKNIEGTQVAAAMEAVKMVTNTSGDDTVTDAQAAIDAAKAEIEGANIPESEKAKLRSKIAMHQGALDRAKDSRMAAKAEETRIAGVVTTITDGEIKAVMDAIARITSLSEESTVTDVEAAIAAAKTAIADANIPEANKELLRTRLALQEDAFGDAKTARMDGHRMGRALYAAMGPSDDTTAPVNALNNLATVPYYITSITDSQHDAPAEATGQRGERGDFRIDPAAGAGSIATANTHTAVYFRHGAEGRPGHDTTMDKVGRWNVTHYERTTGSGSMKVTDKVRVYNDRQGGPLERWGVVPMDAAKFFKDDTDWINKGTYEPFVSGNSGPKHARRLTLGTGVDRAIASATFDKWTVGIGSVTAPKPADGGAEIKVPGTYYGAPGNYFCPASGTCTVGTGVGGGGFGGYFMSADWYFVHDAGAKVLERDLSYMYFGWWVRNDADGMPAAVSAFYQSVGGGVDLATDGKSLNVNRGRAATYEGPAIGWYAINDPLNEKGGGGEFTATATLKAQFGTANLNADTGLTGTIHDFRLKNGMKNDWSVTLNKAAWTTDPSLATDAQKGHIVNTEKTVWSINGNKAAPAGSWVANLYDDKPGTVENGGDGSNHPTAIMGKFQAEHGGTHRMVGAFGTELQTPTTE